MKTGRDELDEIRNRDPSQCAPDLCGMYERGATTTAIAALRARHKRSSHLNASIHAGK